MSADPDQQKTLDTRKPTAKSERRGGTVSNLIPKVSIFITYSSILYISKLQYNTPSLLPAGFFSETKLRSQRGSGHYQASNTEILIVALSKIWQSLLKSRYRQLGSGLIPAGI